MKYFGILFWMIVLPWTAWSQPGWELQNSGTSNWLYAVDFVDSLTGWAVGDYATIRKTTNGGSTWFSQSFGSSVRWTSVDFVDAQNGWITGGDGQIYHTTDGGTNWNIQDLGLNLLDISFGSTTHGWAVGSYSQIRHTTDAGMTWTNQTHPAGSQILRAVHFLDAQRGWIAGSGETLLFTTNGGTSWLQAPSDSLYCDLEAVFFVNADTGFTGGDCSIFGSTTRGQTWHDLWPTFPGYDIQGIHFVSTQKGWLVGNGGKVYYTADGGSVWTEQSSGLASVLEGVVFATPTSGWAVGYGGAIIHTHTGGITARREEIPNGAIVQLFPNPTQGDACIQVETNKPCTASVEIVDIEGRLVYRHSAKHLAGIVRMDVPSSTWRQGIYLVTISISSGMETHRMVEKLVR